MISFTQGLLDIISPELQETLYLAQARLFTHWSATSGFRQRKMTLYSLALHAVVKVQLSVVCSNWSSPVRVSV